MQIPPIIYSKNLHEYVGVKATKWRELRKLGIAPEPKYRSKHGDVYHGSDIEVFLGIRPPARVKDSVINPFAEGLKKLDQLKH